MPEHLLCMPGKSRPPVLSSGHITSDRPALGGGGPGGFGVGAADADFGCPSVPILPSGLSRSSHAVLSPIALPAQLMVLGTPLSSVQHPALSRAARRQVTTCQTEHQNFPTRLPAAAGS